MRISPVGESYRLLHRASHQNLMVAFQVESTGLRLQVDGVILEISARALETAKLAKEVEAQTKVQSVGSLAKPNTDQLLNKKLINGLVRKAP